MSDTDGARMLKQKARLFSTGLLAAELGLWTASFLISPYLFTQVGRQYSLADYSPLLVMALVTWALHQRLSGTYEHSQRMRTALQEGVNVLLGAGIVLLGLSSVIFVAKLESDSRVFVGYFVAAGFVSITTLRVGLRASLQRARAQGYNIRRLAIVGDGDVPLRVAETVRDHREWGLQFAGYIHVKEMSRRVTQSSLGRMTDIAKILDENVIDEVIFAVDNLDLKAIEPALAVCEQAGVSTRLILDFFPHKFSRLEMEDFDGFPMLAFHATSHDEFPLLLKRLFDIAVSGCAIVFGAPIFVAVAAIIKITMPGPVFFVQNRVGRHGREFGMIKFRSMVVNAEQLKAQLEKQNEMAGPAFKMKNDPRITPFGQFIRKTSLDEIPQFFNVLRGEMSVVGPRPPIPSEVAKYERWQRRRLSVKPGLTCIWQVSGRNNVDFDTWMKLDLQYIDNWSLWLDLKLFVMTIPAVLFARGAR